jgi:toxin ParE1/3/4
VKRLVVTNIALADLQSIRRYSTRTCGRDQTTRYMARLRDTLKELVRGAVVVRKRDDLRPGLEMATSGRHCIFFETTESRILVVRVLHDRMDYRRHLDADDAPAEKA